jgi:N-acetylmuramoyl-L-alanine amidase
MPSAGFRCAALLALASAATGCSHAADAPVHAAPSRPEARSSAVAAPAPAASRSAKKPAAPDYIRLSSVATHLGLKLAWIEPGRKAVLSAPGARTEIEADSRDIVVNGLRVFLGDRVTVDHGELAISRTDFERCLAPLLRPGFGTTAPATPKIIVLDPGHGGRDDGTENKKLGLKEKVLTLDVALRLKQLLEAEGYTVLLTRATDRELSPKKELDLPMRAEIANRAHADLFISIHFNAAPGNTRGTEVYTYVPARQHATVWWSELKKDDGDIEAEPQPVNRFDHWSVVFAQALHRHLLRELKTEDRGKKIAHWAVLKTLECPGVLVEPAILSNDGEAKRAAQPEFRQQIAEALAAGVRDYTSTVEAIRAKRAGAPSATRRPRHTSRSS